MKALNAFLMVFVLCLFTAAAHGQQPRLKVMYYNVLNFPGSTPERADTLKVILDHGEPDVLVINELISEAGADLILNKSLPSDFKRAVFKNGPDSDNMIFYDASKLTLVAQAQIPTELRDISEYTMRWNLSDSSFNDSILLHFYSAHLKASSGSENEEKRTDEVQVLLDHLESKSNSQHVIVGGNFNFYDDNEDGFEALMTVLEDPISQIGDWHDNASYAQIHTQSTRTTRFGGGANGGMDDRFDFILMSDELIKGADNVQYVANTYRAIGQDGNRFNGSMIDPRQNADIPFQVVSALHAMSDHLPVMLEIEWLGNPESVAPAASLASYEIIDQQLVLYIKEELHLTIVDVQGRRLISQNLSQGPHRIDLSDEAKVLLVNLQKEDTQQHIKIVLK